MRKQQTVLKNPKQSHKKKKLLIITALALAVVAGVGAFALHKHQKKADEASQIRPQNTVDYSPAKPEDNKATDEAKSNPKDNGTVKNNETPANNQPSPGNFSVTVTGANPDNTNKLARVSTLVNGITSGTCTVNFKQSGQATVTATSQVALITNSYACQNFAVPYDQFPAGGDWSVSVTVESGGKTATGQWQGPAITIRK